LCRSLGCGHAAEFVGASLLAKASEQSALQPNITTNSQAGSLRNHRADKNRQDRSSEYRLRLSDLTGVLFFKLE
jgi:hypothetical protein